MSIIGLLKFVDFVKKKIIPCYNINGKTMNNINGKTYE